jgi:hypothetical protein
MARLDGLANHGARRKTNWPWMATAPKEAEAPAVRATAIASAVEADGNVGLARILYG